MASHSLLRKQQTLATPSWRQACVGTWKPPSTPCGHPRYSGTAQGPHTHFDSNNITSEGVNSNIFSVAFQPLPCFNLSYSLYIYFLLILFFSLEVNTMIAGTSFLFIKALGRKHLNQCLGRRKEGRYICSTEKDCQSTGQ